MNQKIAQQLVKTPEGQAFIDYLKKKINELDTVGGVIVTDPVEIAVEIKARGMALQKLKEILSDILVAGEVAPEGFDPQEYVVE